MYIVIGLALGAYLLTNVGVNVPLLRKGWPFALAAALCAGIASGIGYGSVWYGLAAGFALAAGFPFALLFSRRKWLGVLAATAILIAGLFLGHGTTWLTAWSFGPPTIEMVVAYCFSGPLWVKDYPRKDDPGLAKPVEQKEESGQKEGAEQKN